MRYFNTPAVADIETAFREATKLGAEGFLSLNDQCFSSRESGLQRLP
jgi:hypothetical protein